MNLYQVSYEYHVKLLRVKQRVSLQVNHVGMSPELLTYVAQSGREAASIIRTEDDEY